MVVEYGEKMNLIENEDNSIMFANISEIDALLQEQMRENALKESESIAHALEHDVTMAIMR